MGRLLFGTGLGLFVWLAALLFRQIELTGAVPAAEFGPVGPLYASMPFVAAAGLLITLYGLSRMQQGVFPIVLGAGAGGVLASWLAPVVLPFALAVYATGFTGCLATEVQGEPVKFAFGAGTFLRTTFGLIALFAGAALLLSLGDALLFTSRFVPDLVPKDDYIDYLWALPALSIFVGIHAVGHVGILFLVVLVALKLARRTTPLLLSYLVGLSVSLMVVYLVRLGLDDEMDELQVGWIVVGLAVLLGFAGARMIQRRDSLLEPALDLRNAIARRLLFLLVPPMGLRLERRVLRSRPLFRGIAATVGLVAVAGSTALLYPTVEDYRIYVFPSYALLATFLLSGVLYAVLPMRNRAFTRTATIVVLVAGVISWFTATTDSETRIVAHEYSRFGSLGAESPLVALVDTFPQLGRSADHAKTGREPTKRNLPAWDGGPIEGRPPILVVIWDAARPDHMSAYGYARRTTPHVEAMAKDAVLFERAYSMSTATTHGVRHLMSGRYSTRYMLAKHTAPFFVRELADHGYDQFVITVAGNDHNGVSADAFQRSWDSDREGLTWIELDFPFESRKPDRKKTQAVLEVLERRLKQKGNLDGTFIYYHVVGPHSPWRNADPVVDFGGEEADRYDGEIAKVDVLFGELVAKLEAWGVYDRMIVVLTADHATGLGEHGRFAGFLPYEEQVRVPLIIKAPGFRGRRVKDLVASIDVAPTMVNLLEGARANPYDGRSLVPLMNGTAEHLPPRPIVLFCAFRDSYAVIDENGRYKLHHHRGRAYEALFDLQNDPGERKNLISKKPGIAAKLRDYLDGFLWEGRSSYGNPYHYRAWKPAD